MQNTLAQSIRSGLLWNSGSRIMIKILSLGVGIIMARILTPEDFGIVAIAMVVWQMIALLGQMGLGAKLIHQKDNIPEYANASFWMNIIVYTAIAVFAVVISPFVATFYDNPASKLIIQIMAAGYVLSAIGNTHLTLLQKRMDFRALSIVDVGLTLLKNIVAVGMVLSGCGFWSLILPELIIRPVRIIALWRLEPWRPRFNLGLEYWRDILGFGIFVFGTTVIRYLNINGDYLITGKLLGTASLGLYQFGYGLANWPIQNIVPVFSLVMFPAFSRLQNDLKEMQQLYLKLAETISIVIFPCLFGLASVAHLLVPVVYGEKWNLAVLPMKIIITFTMVRSIATLGGNILMALGQPQIEFKMNACQVIPLLTAVVIGSRFGIVGVAAGMSLVLSGFAIWFILLTNKAMDLPIRHLVKAVVPALASSGILWIVVYQYFTFAVALQFGAHWTLIIGVCIGAATYTLCMILFFNKTSKRFIVRCRQIFASIVLSNKPGRMKLENSKSFS